MDGPETFDPSTYAPGVSELLLPVRLPELGPGKPDPATRTRLARLDPATVLGGAPPADIDMARACLSGLWLYHDFLDESHRISQSIETSTGSYWHGIMHRREPDFDNARYWFRRVGTHPVLALVTGRVRELATTGEAKGVSPRLADLLGRWGPFAFIDACEASLGAPGPDHALCRQIALIEWQLLFDYTYRRATGKTP